MFAFCDFLLEVRLQTFAASGFEDKLLVHRGDRRYCRQRISLLCMIARLTWKLPTDGLNPTHNILPATASDRRSRTKVKQPTTEVKVHANECLRNQNGGVESSELCRG